MMPAYFFLCLFFLLYAYLFLRILLRVLLLFAAVKFDYPDRNHNGDGSGSGWVGIFGAREVIEAATAQPTRG